MILFRFLSSLFADFVDSGGYVLLCKCVLCRGVSLSLFLSLCLYSQSLSVGKKGGRERKKKRGQKFVIIKFPFWKRETELGVSKEKERGREREREKAITQHRLAEEQHAKLSWREREREEKKGEREWLKWQNWSEDGCKNWLRKSERERERERERKRKKHFAILLQTSMKAL